MKTKTVNARQFLHQFAKLEKNLLPGECIMVTRRGEPVGRFTKEPLHRKIIMPDFQKDACKPGFTVEDGNVLLARMLKDEELS